MKIPRFTAAAVRFGKFAACLLMGIAAHPQSVHSAPSYGTAALANSPAAFWQLNETGDPSSGTLTAADSSGNGRNGTYGTTSLNGSHGIVAPQPPTYGGFALNQGALQTTAADVNSPVTVPALNLNTNAVTIAMWINPSGPVGTFTGLLMNRDAGGDAAGFSFGGLTDANAMAALGYTWNGNAQATWDYDSGLFPVAGIWQFVALVVRSNSATIYLYYVDPNSGTTNLLSAVNAIPHTAQAFSSGATFIGSDVLNGSTPDSARVFGGGIAGVAVYQSALTPDQILTLFAAGVGVDGLPPSIATQPQSRYVVSGSSAQLRATVNGSSPLAYQWQLNGTNVNLLATSANYSGANSNVLSIGSMTAAAAGSYQLIVTNLYGTASSSNAVLTLQAPSLVGRWFTNNSLADISGYTTAGTHDAFPVGGVTYEFTNDVPAGKTGQSLLLSSASGMAISNSSTLDPAYADTFDDRINNAMTVAVWAKGWPAAWDPFVSKYGEAGLGWQIRQFGQDGVNPAWTVRGAGGTVTLGVAGGFAGVDDLGSTGFPLGNDTNNWHFYVGTFDASTGERHMYIDGQLAASAIGSVPYALAPASFLAIGARDNGGNTFGNFFNGQIYDARMYNYALEHSEVLALYGVNPPTIAVQPSSISVFAGEPARLSVTVAGTPPLSYQWQLNGTNVNLLPNSANYSGANSNVLTVLNTSAAHLGSYKVIVTNLYGTAISSNATVSLAEKRLVGRWFNGPASLADVSGHQPAGTHDGTPVGGGSHIFTNDVPPGLTGQSLFFPTADSGIAIQNSANTDPAYTNTFDEVIHSHMTVAVWAKGTRDSWSWNPWISKRGEGAGWQLRTGGADVLTPAWTVRSGGVGTYTLGGGPGWAPNGSLDDLHGAISGVGAGMVRYPIDNNWHLYVGTYNAVTGVRNLYVDGVLRGQVTNDGPYTLAANTPVVIGGRYNPDTGVFEAHSVQQIYDARIYNYDLTLQEVQDLMPDPVITVQPPQTRTAYVGTTLRISATVQALASPVTNQWQFNGVNLNNGAFGGGTISGANSSALTISSVTASHQGTYRLIVSNSKGTVISSNTVVTVQTPFAPPAGTLVGAWLTGAANLADTSGYTPAGTHNGFGVTGTGTPSSNYAFSNDVPPGQSGQSLTFTGNTTIAISNSSNIDVAYTNTFDDTITNMTVMIWAKGWPAAWNPFIAKYGEAGAGWQLRRNGGGSNPTWTVRGTGANEDMAAPNLTMGNDGLWHHYAGTFTFDGVTGTRSLYVDGILVATQTEVGPYITSPSSHLTIGGRDNGGNMFDNYFVGGSVYGARVFKTALTEPQINNFLVATAPSVPAFSGPPILSGGKFVLSWTSGTLLQATNVLGPWLPTGATSPYTNDVTSAPQMFFKLSNP